MGSVCAPVEVVGNGGVGGGRRRYIQLIHEFSFLFIDSQAELILS